MPTNGLRESLPRTRLIVLIVLILLLGAVGCLELVPTLPSNNDPESFCSQMGSAWFYCNTSTVTTSTPLPNGWPGFCDMTIDPMPAGTISGYAGIGLPTAQGRGATQVWLSAQDLDRWCYPSGLQARCSSIVRCTRH